MGSAKQDASDLVSRVKPKLILMPCTTKEAF